MRSRGAVRTVSDGRTSVLVRAVRTARAYGIWGFVRTGVRTAEINGE
ncbi:hypothetical protein L083_0386 [Actinoplanes sp. N902-109]|nr:hypothetical protein L083_0386 [Actinoplanes sp. N902-109]